jgi:hypothetical protein
MTRRVRLLTALACLALAALLACQGASAGTAARSPIPVLAYYYIWFEATSWDRAKVDYPLLGRYASDERRVMERHVAWAKESGIDGFIVSWKSTWRLNRRLELLMEVAAEADFKLAVIYQGLDFDREPLQVERIKDDLDFFIDTYASSPVFDLFEKPLLIWSGTWRFPRGAVQAVTASRRNDLLILSSEKDVSGYARLHRLVDGNAYYWSSANPVTYARFGKKLTDLEEAVHADRGLWIAPVAPGFDARLIGGVEVVPRRAGETLRERWDAAVASSPDAIGIISWNEFSENTHIEPSERYGTRYLEAVADIIGAQPRSLAELDSSDTAPTDEALSGAGYGAPLLGAMVALLGAVVFTVVNRRRRASGRTRSRRRLAIEDLQRPHGREP